MSYYIYVGSSEDYIENVIARDALYFAYYALNQTEKNVLDCMKTGYCPIEWKKDAVPHVIVRASNKSANHDDEVAVLFLPLKEYLKFHDFVQNDYLKRHPDSDINGRMLLLPSSIYDRYATIEKYLIPMFRGALEIVNDPNWIYENEEE